MDGRHFRSFKVEKVLLEFFEEKGFFLIKTVPMKLYNDINNEVFLGDNMRRLGVAVLF